LAVPTAWLAAGLAAYAAGRTGGPLCRPGSIWQWHGVWHIASAAALACAALRLLSVPNPQRER
ncbi:MAG: hypothetical protein ACRDY7_09535, partial [Acidimicrobiia bacterium]